MNTHSCLQHHVVEGVDCGAHDTGEGVDCGAHDTAWCGADQESHPRESALKEDLGVEVWGVREEPEQAFVLSGDVHTVHPVSVVVGLVVRSVRWWSVS